VYAKLTARHAQSIRLLQTATWTPLIARGHMGLIVCMGHMVLMAVAAHYLIKRRWHLDGRGQGKVIIGATNVFVAKMACLARRSSAGGLLVTACFPMKRRWHLDGRGQGEVIIGATSVRVHQMACFARVNSVRVRLVILSIQPCELFQSRWALFTTVLLVPLRKKIRISAG